MTRSALILLLLKVGRLPSEAIDHYWASPVYGDGKIFVVSEAFRNQ